MTLPTYADQLGSIPAFSHHFADLKWLNNAGIPCGTHKWSLFMWSLKPFKKNTQTQKLLMDAGMIQRTQQGSLWRETDFTVEADPCQDGNTCQTDYNSTCPLIVTSGKIIRHLHRRIGHYLEKHICTPELSTSSWSQALVSLSLMWNTFLKWHRGDWSTVPSNSPNPFHSFHWILSQARGWQIWCRRKKV